MSAIPASLRRFVLQRAGERCEYCGLSQTGQEATFHIDHVVPARALDMNRAIILAIRAEEELLGRHPPS